VSRHLARRSQGAGKIDLENAGRILSSYPTKGRASLVPGTLDFTDCPYMWPHCTQPLYHGAMPFMFNATIVNGMGAVGWIEKPPTFTRASDDDLSEHLDVRFAHSETLWPWTGFLAMYVRVKASGKELASPGIARGTIAFTVASPPGAGEREVRTSDVAVPVTFHIAPTPPRERRLLWSQYHSVRYPPGYVPRDNLDAKADILDWHGDHPHTNFHATYDWLRNNGYFLEVLGSPLTCFDASQYGAILLVDPEEEFSEEEISKLTTDVNENGLSVAVFGEWYNVPIMEKMKFFDDNTHNTWTPITGGANVPALNDLLKPFGYAFGDRVLQQAVVPIGGSRLNVQAGANVARAPAGAWTHVGDVSERDARHEKPRRTNRKSAVASFFQVGEFTGPPQGLNPKPTAEGSSASPNATAKSGRLALFGDSGCLDSSHQGAPCHDFLGSILRFLTENDRSTGLTDANTKRGEAYATPADEPLPSRRVGVDFDAYSTTRGGKPGNEGSTTCGPNDPMEFWPAGETFESVSAWSSKRAAAGRFSGRTPPARTVKDARDDSPAEVPRALIRAGGGGGGDVRVRATRDDDDDDDVDASAPFFSSSPDAKLGVPLGAAIVASLLMIARRRRRRGKRAGDARRSVQGVAVGASATTERLLRRKM
jgi:membrane-bound transcription factor site-1 protease